METDFYDKDGHPKIYLSTKYYDTLYTWDGHAVAYLIEDKIYGWRGKHLGWCVDGVIYNMNGYRLGTTPEQCPQVIDYQTADPEPKHTKYNRVERFDRIDSVYSRPVLKDTYADMDLDDFMTQDVAYKIFR